MKILVDLQGAQASGINRGIGRYSLAFTESILQKKSKLFDIHLLVNGSIKKTALEIKVFFSELCSSENFHVFFVSSEYLGSKKDYSQSVLIRNAVINDLNPDIVLTTSFFESADSQVICSIEKEENYLSAAILYDLIPLLHPKIYLESTEKKEWYQRCLQELEKSDLILCISNYTKSCAERHLKNSNATIVNIGGAIDQKKFLHKKNQSNIRSELLLNRLNIKKNFLFCVSGMDPRKNLDFLLHSYSILEEKIKESFQLVITCSMNEASLLHLRKKVLEFSINEENVIFTGFVSDEELIYLYSSCYLFIFPSWEEGLGLPVLEAMACSAPCLIANAASLKEIGGEDQIAFDPFDPHDLKEKIEQITSSKNLLDLLKKISKKESPKYTWNLVADRTLRSLKKIFTRSKPKRNLYKSARKIKPKLAFFSPLPPEKSGIANYSIDLINYLKKYYDITFVNVANIRSLNNLNEYGIESLSLSGFKKNFQEFDRTLYHFGNSIFHVSFFDLLRNYPGVSVLHDFYLNGVVNLLPNYQEKLYVSHGFVANHHVNFPQIFKELPDYPNNLSVIDSSLGVIFHSDYALKLMNDWYGDLGLKKSRVVPFLKKPLTLLNKKEALKILDLKPDVFVVVSFGYLGPNKMNMEVLNGWLNSSIAKKSILVFVGQSGDDNYCKNLKNKISLIKDDADVRITNWVSWDDYKAWLSVADVSIQLRTNSRGETSASVLDCLISGVPTIVNQHGDMANIEKDCVMFLTENCSSDEVSSTLEKLFYDCSYREQLAKKGISFVNNKHSPENCSEKYYLMIEEFYKKTRFSPTQALKKLSFKNQLPKKEPEMSNFVNALVKSIPGTVRKPAMFVDISELVQRDVRTGIQRVVRNVLRSFLQVGLRNSCYRVEPVYTDSNLNSYFVAGGFVSKFLGLPGVLKDYPIEPRKGDVFLGLDLQPSLIPKKKELLDEMFMQGVSVQFVVYDLLPLSNENFFPQGASKQFKLWLDVVSSYEKLICISESTRIETKNWLEKNSPKKLKNLKLKSFTLANELTSEDMTYGDPEIANKLRGCVKEENLFIMVGTMEPRKGHKEVFEALKLLWEEGVKVNLLIIGKQGWCVDALSKEIRLNDHFEKNLFWLKKCSDEFLLEMYSTSTGLIAASYAEGYGLPLVESQNYGLEVFARDIGVFREIDEKFKSFTFFSSKNPFEFKKQFLAWKNGVRRQKRKILSSSNSICWKKATKELENVINDKS